jgi:hypothetical protein
MEMEGPKGNTGLLPSFLGRPLISLIKVSSHRAPVDLPSNIRGSQEAEALLTSMLGGLHHCTGTNRET